MFRDKVFFNTLLNLAIPIIVQDTIFASLNMIDVMMLGQLGETSVAAVGLGYQLNFLMIFLIFGTVTGAAVFSAQYWGKRDIPGLRKVLGMCLLVAVGGAVLFSLLAILIPEQVLRFYTTDPVVIGMGVPYLQITSISYIFSAITASYSFTLRSVENTRLPMIVGVSALALKTGLNYLLIFGNLGLPAMGVSGAALATTIARVLECAVLLFWAYKLRTPAAATLREMSRFDMPFIKQFARTAMPVAVNELLWSAGISAYNAVYAHMGTDAIATVNVSGSIENLAFVIFIGISDATAVMIGNLIGAGEGEKAFKYARRSLILGVSLTVVVGVLIYLMRGLILSAYKLSPGSLNNLEIILTIFAATLWVRVSNMTLFVGILRSGGDTRFTLVIDGFAIWLVGVPMALLGAFVFNLPVHWVYLMVISEEVVKFFIVMARFLSKRWINDVTVPAGEPAA